MYMAINTQKLTQALGVLLLSPVFMLCGSVVSAHSEGASFEQVIDGYIVDIGYSPENIVAKTSVPFDFGLNLSSGEEVLYESIWVRVSQDRNVFYAGGIHRSSVGATTMLYQFPEPGVYTLSARFQDGVDALTEVSFEVEVGAPTDSSDSKVGGTPVLAFLVVALLSAGSGILGARYFFRRRVHT